MRSDSPGERLSGGRAEGAEKRRIPPGIGQFFEVLGDRLSSQSTTPGEHGQKVVQKKEPVKVHRLRNKDCGCYFLRRRKGTPKRPKPSKVKLAGSGVDTPVPF